MARPTKIVKLTSKQTIRFKVSEVIILKRMASDFGLTFSEYVRAKAVDIKIKPRLTEDETKYFRQLVGMANNLNQLAKSANERELLVKEIVSTLGAINNLIERMK